MLQSLLPQRTLTNGVLAGTTTLSGMTAGSVLFAGTAGVLSQDNANFFWDDTNNHLGIGTASPGDALHIFNGRFNITTDGNGSLIFSNYSGVTRITSASTAGGGSIGIGREPVVVHGQPAGDYSVELWSGANGNTLTVEVIGGLVGIGTTTPQSLLSLGPSSTGFRNYNSYTDASNGEWYEAVWAANVLTLGTNKNGTGVARALVIKTGGTTALTISTTQGVTFANEIAMTKMTASGTAPGAGVAKFEVIAGTNAGTAKLIMYAGTSTTPLTIADNVGSGF